MIEFQEEGNRTALQAVCLGHINGFYHFYTITGKWVPGRRISSHFVVRGFVDEKILQPIIEKLPQEVLPLETLRTMANMKLGPDRVCAAELLRKMIKFQQDTDTILQRYATKFEKAHDIVSKTGKRYVTLNEVYTCLFSHEKKPVPLTPPILYAIHCTILVDDIGFKLIGNIGDATTWLFEVTRPEDVALIQNMQTLVRLLTDIPGKVKSSLTSLTSEHLEQSQLGRFIIKAREAIEQSRESRDWTPHGILGPEKKPRAPVSPEWTDVDISILHFIHLWAGYNQFSSSSRLHWTGSAILRATGKYKDSEYLSTTTAWTFLQEVGYITPWDFSTRYTNRLPNVETSRASGLSRLPLGPAGIEPYLSADIFDGKRHDWAGLRAFAIDSKDTTDIDDAVSIEATNVPDEHWIHIHVADPASRIRHDCALGDRAEITPLNLYLSGHQSNIWGLGDEVKNLFSLAPDRPCLTFSGKVNEDGKLLEYKITPGKLQEFVYMTPEDANDAVGHDNSVRPPVWSSTDQFTVGQLPNDKPAGRQMTAAAELRPEDLKSLKTLYRLADTLHQKRVAKGALPFYPTQLSVKASFDNTSIDQTPLGLVTGKGDPSISLSWGDRSSPMISSTMQFAGEIAARWCEDRNIPIPYLSQPDAQKNLTSLQLYSEKVMLPVLHHGGVFEQEHWIQLRRLLGSDKLSTQPGPHYLMGSDSYAKVTSPLRRYSDLLAHWQIENALVQEMKTGRVVEKQLPLLRDDLDNKILPWLHLRQRIIRRLGNWDGNRAYMLQALLRAWKFPSPSSSQRLPEQFKLTVGGTVANSMNAMIGTLDWFGLEAWLVVEGLKNLGLKAMDVRKGDVFEVRLVDVDVHQGNVFVQATGKIETQ